MIQIVIPTMCLCPKEIFSYTLKQIDLSKHVDKVIIVDNTIDKKFRKEYQVGEKFEVIEEGKNIYVNPAWNLGLEKVTSDNYMILNDDIAVHKYIFDKLDNIMNTMNDVGLCTVRTTENMTLKDYEEKMNEICENNPPNEFNSKMLNPQNIQGWLMVGRKKDWTPIPKELRIWYGDNLIYSRCKKSGKRILNLSSCFVNHITSSTVSKSPSEVRKKINAIIKKENNIFIKGNFK